jgi:hypothetical protein
MGCERHVERALELSTQLLELANEDREGCDHDGCLMLDGIVRDCALQIKKVALRWGLDLGRHEMRRGAIDTMEGNEMDHPHGPRDYSSSSINPGIKEESP